MTRALLVVDVQVDFCEDGSLPVAGGKQVAADVRALLSGDHGYDLVVASEDWHVDPGDHFAAQPDFVRSWPAHCVVGTGGARLQEPLTEDLFDADEPTVFAPPAAMRDTDGDPPTPLAAAPVAADDTFDQPRLLEGPVDVEAPPPEDEETTIHEWSRPQLLAEATTAVPEEDEEAPPEALGAAEADTGAAAEADRSAAAEPEGGEPEGGEPEAIGEVEAIAEDDPSLPWNRPVARVPRNHQIGRFGGVNPGASGAPAPAGSVLPTRADPPPPLPAVTAVAREALNPGQLLEATASAPGKVILLGEHAVVFGHRAIAAAVSLQTTVTVYRRPGPSRVEQTSIQDPRLAAAVATEVAADGIGVRISSDVPMGCGMGSSAALAIAVVQAITRLEGREASLRELVDRGFALERVFHGNPSGLDHTVSASGGALLFRKGAPAEDLRVKKPLRLVIANTGTPSNTAQMVEGVRRRNPVELLMRLGALVEMAAAAISRGDPIGGYLNDAHRCLRLMGVSTPQLDELCRAMEAAGSTGAKLSGAGGGGIAIALVDEATEEAVQRAAQSLVGGGVYTAVIPASPPRA